MRETWTNPGFNPATNAGDLAVLTLADALPGESVIPMAETGDEAYAPGTAAVVYGWGDTTGNSDYASSLRSAKVSVLPDAACAQAYQGAATARTTPQRCSARANCSAGTTHARATAAGRWWPVGGSSDWCPGGTAAPGQAARGCTRGSPPRSAGCRKAAERHHHAGTRTGGPLGGAARRQVRDLALARRGCEVSVLFLFGGLGLHSREPVRLILYFRGDLLEFRLELATVVGAEEQFTAADQDDAQICLGAATVTAVCCGQRARGGQNSSHVASSLARRAVVPGSTSNQAENVPARGFSSKLLLEMAVCCRLAANVPYCGALRFRVACLGGILPAGLPVCS